MAAREYTIQLRVDFEEDTDHEGKHAMILRAAKTAAKHLAATCTLVSDKRQPTIALFTSDMFVGKEEIDLVEDTLAD